MNTGVGYAMRLDNNNNNNNKLEQSISQCVQADNVDWWVFEHEKTVLPWVSV